MGGREGLWSQQGKRKEEKMKQQMHGWARQAEENALLQETSFFFEGNLSFILVLLSTRHVQTVDVLPFLKAC